MFPVHVKHRPTGDHDCKTGAMAKSSAIEGAAPIKCSKLSSTSSIGVRNQSRRVSLSISRGAFCSNLPDTESLNDDRSD